MYICYLVLVTASAVYGNRIIGGTDANIEDFPYQVSVEYNNWHSCGGSIITPTKVLTAAHCTISRPVNRFRVRAGSTWRDQGGQVVNVIKKIEHPDYSSATVNSDLSILILSEPLILNDKVKTINIAQTEDVPAGTMANVTGWGITEAGVLADRLLLVSVPKVDTPTCKKYYGSVYNATTMICYGGVVGKDSCTVTYGNRIIGGTDANIEDFPYQVSVEYGNKHSCGGSIITPTKVLTAAHCTINQSANKFRVRAGSAWREQGGQVVNVIKKVEHPDYNPPKINSDLSILILSKPLLLDNKVKTINIAQVEDVPVGTAANVTGWGVTEANVLSDRLLVVDVPRVDDQICKKRFPTTYNASTMICYGGVVGKDSCTSDSGGPLVIDGEQHGVISYGVSPCGGKAPAIYVKLHFFTDFIANTN
ncbi:hypothetical protein RN001_010586 [Aquatica leii]|uniref:Peptidase S1 domain-containing protein n=1 Tax=Aquatica leii TaxID=1421715 RepID=A0AAN7P169_9COLE|nr:hypothetical protein RN001_010586 [Aquatica leii]